MKILAALVLILSLASCQHPTTAPAPDPLYWLAWSGPLLDSDYYYAAEEAVSHWNEALNRPVFAFGWHPFVGVDITQVPYRLEAGDGVLALGRTYSPHLIAVTTDTDKSAYRIIVEHELGHILGLKHSQNPKDLMYSAPQVTNQLTPDDRRRALEILESRNVNGQY